MLELIKNNEIDDFNTQISETLTGLALKLVQEKRETLSETELSIDANFITEMFDFIGLESVEYEDGEVSGITDSINIARLANEQLEETNAPFSVEVISDIDGDLDGLDGDDLSGEEIDIDTYIANDGDIFVITVFLDAISEGGNPFKRVAQKSIRGGKRVRTLVKNKKKGFRRGSDGKTRKQKGSEKIARARGNRKGARKTKAKKGVRVRKFKRSIKKSNRIRNRAKRRT